MSIETWVVAFSMGKHGVYVWSAYILFFVVVIGWWFFLHFEMKRWLHERMLRKNREIRHEKLNNDQGNINGVNE